MSEILLHEHRDGVAWVTLNRPEAMNALSRALNLELMELAWKLADDAALRAVVITGAGDRAFSAGADLRERKGVAAEDTGPFVSAISGAIDAVARIPRPTLALVNGVAFGGGLELALACDFRIATRRSEFAFPEVRLGMIPGSGGTQRALRLIGMTRGKLFMMTGQRISAERAEAWGLITQCVADDMLGEAVGALAGELAERAPLALRTLKTVLDRGADAPLDTALELERKAYAWLRSTHDYEEGVKSFVEKRAPRYRGR